MQLMSLLNNFSESHYNAATPDIGIQTSIAYMSDLNAELIESEATIAATMAEMEFQESSRRVFKAIEYALTTERMTPGLYGICESAGITEYIHSTGYESLNPQGQYETTALLSACRAGLEEGESKNFLVRIFEKVIAFLKELGRRIWKFIKDILFIVKTSIVGIGVLIIYNIVMLKDAIRDIIVGAPAGAKDIHEGMGMSVEILNKQDAELNRIKTDVVDKDWTQMSEEEEEENQHAYSRDNKARQNERIRDALRDLAVKNDKEFDIFMNRWCELKERKDDYSPEEYEREFEKIEKIRDDNQARYQKEYEELETRIRQGLESYDYNSLTIRQLSVVKKSASFLFDLKNPMKSVELMGRTLKSQDRLYKALLAQNEHATDLAEKIQIKLKNTPKISSAVREKVLNTRVYLLAIVKVNTKMVRMIVGWGEAVEKAVIIIKAQHAKESKENQEVDETN